MKEAIEKLKRRVEMLKRRKGEGREGKSAEGKGKEVEVKVKESVRWREMEERERRRKNVVVKGIEVKEGGIKGAIEEIWKEIGAKAEIEEMREVGNRNE